VDTHILSELMRALIVVTRNVRDFDGCGIAVLNPFTLYPLANVLHANGLQAPRILACDKATPLTSAIPVPLS
jgi:hypothetical protein